LIRALQAEKSDIIDLLLEKGASVNAQDKDKRTPLIWAATKHDSAALIRLLLRRGADPSMKDVMGNDALSRARLCRT
jgi:uncharacterized protein